MPQRPDGRVIPRIYVSLTNVGSSAQKDLSEMRESPWSTWEIPGAECHGGHLVGCRGVPATKVPSNPQIPPPPRPVDAVTSRSQDEVARSAATPRVKIANTNLARTPRPTRSDKRRSPPGVASNGTSGRLANVGLSVNVAGHRAVLQAGLPTQSPSLGVSDPSGAERAGRLAREWENDMKPILVMLGPGARA
jgi:hypothetical protein